MGSVEEVPLPGTLAQEGGAPPQEEKQKKVFKKDLPFSQFLNLLSFIASIGVGLSLSAALSAQNASDPALAASLAKDRYAYATACFTGGLSMGLAGQLLLTSRTIMEGALMKAEIYILLAVFAYGGIGSTVAGMLLVGAGLLATTPGAAALLMAFVVGPATVALISFWFTL